MTSERLGGSIEYKARDPKTVDSESYPRIDLVASCYSKATQLTAITTHLNIQHLTGGKIEDADLDSEEKVRRIGIIDPDAERTYTQSVSSFPFTSHCLDAEGTKEKYSEVGEAMPVTLGLLGTGLCRVSSVADYVEGTGFSVHGRPNAISVVGISDYNGITKIPDIMNTEGEPEEASYFRKLFGPSEFKDDISLLNSPGQNIERIMKIAGIPASSIKVITMARNCNATIIREAQQIGAQVEQIKAGDLAWCLRAILSEPENPILMMGRGGAPEGSIAAVAARALNATGQLRVVIDNKRDIEMQDDTPVWTADEFVPGAPEHSMTIFSAITANTHFDMRAVQKHAPYSHSYYVDTMVIDSKGFRIKTIVIDSEKQ